MNIVIIGDSMVVIQKCMSLSKSQDLIDSKTSPLYIRKVYLLRKIEKFKLSHVKKTNNKVVDAQANIGVELEQ